MSFCTINFDYFCFCGTNLSFLFHFLVLSNYFFLSLLFHFFFPVSTFFSFLKFLLQQNDTIFVQFVFSSHFSHSKLIGNYPIHSIHFLRSVSRQNCLCVSRQKCLFHYKYNFPSNHKVVHFSQESQ